MRSVRSWCRFLCRQGTLEANPADGLRGPRLDRTLPHFLTEDGMATLVAAPVHETPLGLRDRAILETLYSAGLDKAIAPKRQSLGSIRSCFGIPDEHGVRELPFPFSLLLRIEIVIRLFGMGIDSDCDHDRRGFTIVHSWLELTMLLCLRSISKRKPVGFMTSQARNPPAVFRSTTLALFLLSCTHQQLRAGPRRTADPCRSGRRPHQ